MKNLLLLLATTLTFTTTQGQATRALFLGNSYTGYNNLPQMVADMASSTGETMVIDSHTPGGATFNAHSLNTTSLGKIMAGDWDYVILQGQSLEMWGSPTNILVSHPQTIVLDSLIHAHSPCVETMFYRTWGRKNGFGGTSYQTMDSSIHENYMKLADSLDAVVSPVGQVWKYIRQNYPNIELYDTDGSHPSLAGSYAAACTFYTAIFRGDPTAITFNSNLPPFVTADIRTATKLVVYDSLLTWHIGEYDSLMSAACLTSVQDLYSTSPIDIFPNPFSSHTTLRTSTTFHNATLSIVNCFGQAVQRVPNISGHTITFRRGDLPSGLYFLRLTEGRKAFVGRLIVSGD